MPKKNNSFSNRLLSVAVLIGFICVQFHSLTHIDLTSLSSAKAQKTENTTASQITGHSSSQKDAIVDCADCVLTKHLQASVEENGSTFSDHASGLVTLGNENQLFDSSNHTFQLRAPPFTSFS